MATALIILAVHNLLFSLMVELLAAVKGDAVYLTYLPQLEKEYNYWMEGSDKLKPLQSNKSVVKLKNGSLLNRYWDDLDIPRQEAYYEDQLLSSKFTEGKAKKINRDLRAAAASGWDFSSRWFADKKILPAYKLPVLFLLILIVFCINWNW